MSGPSTAKKKRAHDDPANPKRLKLASSNGNGAKKPLPFENTLSLPIQEALYKFREASEQELIRLRKEGLEPSAAINKLVDKMRTIESDVSPCFSRQELDLVMEMAGINEEGAMRALILRSELAKLRHDGFNHPEAINELARRMKRLAGSKRRISLSLPEGAFAEPKHRRLEAFPSTTAKPTNFSRVSFTRLDPTNDLSPLDVPGTRKRLLHDALMLDEEGWGLRKRPRIFDKDIPDSEDESGDDLHPLDSELYHFDDVGEFSQDEEGEHDEGDEDDEDGDELLGVRSLEDIPLFSAFSADYPSSDEEHMVGREFGLHSSNHRGEGEAEGEESDFDVWTPPTTTTSTTTTGRSTFTTSSTTSTFSLSPASTNSTTTSTTSTYTASPTPTATSRTPRAVARTARTPRVPKTTKQRDSSTSFSQRTVS